MPQASDYALKWLKFSFTFIQLGLSVLVIVLVRFRLHGSSSGSSGGGGEDVCLLAPPQEWSEACTFADVVASISMLFTFLTSLLQLYFTNQELNTRNRSRDSLDAQPGSAARKRLCGIPAHAIQFAVLSLAAMWWAAAAAILTYYAALADSSGMARPDIRALVLAAAWTSTALFIALLALEVWQQAAAKRRQPPPVSRSSSRITAAVSSRPTPSFSRQGSGGLYPAYHPAAASRSFGGQFMGVPVMGVVAAAPAAPAAGTAIGIPVFQPVPPHLMAAAAADGFELTSSAEQPAAAAAAAASGGAVEAASVLSSSGARGLRAGQQQQQQGLIGAAACVGGPGAGQTSGIAGHACPAQPPPAAAAAVPGVLLPPRTTVRYAAVTDADLQPPPHRAGNYSAASGVFINGRELGAGGSSFSERGSGPDLGRASAGSSVAARDSVRSGSSLDARDPASWNPGQREGIARRAALQAADSAPAAAGHALTVPRQQLHGQTLSPRPTDQQHQQHQQRQ